MAYTITFQREGLTIERHHDLDLKGKAALANTDILANEIDARAEARNPKSVPEPEGRANRRTGIEIVMHHDQIDWVQRGVELILVASFAIFLAIYLM